MKVSLAHFAITKYPRPVIAPIVLQEVAQIITRFYAVAANFVACIQLAGEKDKSYSPVGFAVKSNFIFCDCCSIFSLSEL
jgi:hypothetical protein